MDSTKNINEMIARNLSNIADASFTREAPMSTAQLGQYGWRELGLYLAGSHGGKSTDFAVVGSRGTVVGH